MSRLKVTVTENPADVGWRWYANRLFAVGLYWDTTDTADEAQAWPYLPRPIFRHGAIGLWTKWACAAVKVHVYRDDEDAS